MDQTIYNPLLFIIKIYAYERVIKREIIQSIV